MRTAPSCSSHDIDGSCLDDGFGSLFGRVAGALLGAVGAILVDDVALSSKTRPVAPPKPGVGLTIGGVRGGATAGIRGHGGATAGIRGTF